MTKKRATKSPHKTTTSVRLADLLPVENVKGGSARPKIVFGAKVSATRKCTK